MAQRPGPPRSAPDWLRGRGRHHGRIIGAQAVVTVRNWNTVTTLLELTS